MPVKVLNVDSAGVRLQIHREVFNLAYSHFPWFEGQPHDAIRNVEEVSRGHFRWPDLDVDLSQAMIENPKGYPLETAHEDVITDEEKMEAVRKHFNDDRLLDGESFFAELDSEDAELDAIPVKPRIYILDTFDDLSAIKAAVSPENHELAIHVYFQHQIHALQQVENLVFGEVKSGWPDRGKGVSEEQAMGIIGDHLALLRKRKNNSELMELLEGVTPEKCRPEIDWGPAVGKERWGDYFTNSDTVTDDFMNDRNQPESPDK